MVILEGAAVSFGVVLMLNILSILSCLLNQKQQKYAHQRLVLAAYQFALPLLYIHMQLTKMQFTSFQITNHIKCVVPITNYSQWKKTLQFPPNLARERRGGVAVASLVTNSLELRPSPLNLMQFKMNSQINQCRSLNLP